MVRIKATKGGRNFSSSENFNLNKKKYSVNNKLKKNGKFLKKKKNDIEFVESGSNQKSSRKFSNHESNIELDKRAESPPTIKNNRNIVRNVKFNKNSGKITEKKFETEKSNNLISKKIHTLSSKKKKSNKNFDKSGKNSFINKNENNILSLGNDNPCFENDVDSQSKNSDDEKSLSSVQKNESIEKIKLDILNSDNDIMDDELNQSDSDEEINYKNLESKSTNAMSDDKSTEGEEGYVDVDLDEDDDDIDVNLEDDGSEKPFTGDLAEVKQRISSCVTKLASCKRKQGDPTPIVMKKSRQAMLQQLIKDVSIFYGYSLPLAEYFLTLFSPAEAISFFEAAEQPRPMTIRTNMLLTRRRDLAKTLIARGCNVDPLAEWSKVGLKVIDSTVPVGATPEYCGGQYMIQSASSFIPVMALAPRPGELILDMAAAPGGKTTYIGQLMKNSGVLFCNELKKERTVALVANIHRMGLTNTVVINMDGLDLKGKLPALDRVLLDAPCTGLGVISRDPTVKTRRGPKDFKEKAELQKKLLLTAIDLVSANSATGGFVVYSTCSLSIEENEAVVNYAINVRNIKAVSLGIDLGEPGIIKFKDSRFHPSIKEARRIYPHVNNMDGFFVCKLKKISDEIPERIKKDRNKKNEYVKNWGAEFLNETIDFPDKENSSSEEEQY